MDALPVDAGEAWPADAVEVARIVDAWGVKGWIKLQPLGTDAQALLSAPRWHLRPAPRPMPTEVPALLHVVQARRHGDTVVATVRELADRNAARALRGARVYVARSSFPRTAADEYYWVDLIGAEVVNRRGELLGQVSALIDTGAHSVLCVRRPGAAAELPDAQAERLIPFVAAYVDDVDTAARCIRVDWSTDY